MTTTTDHQVGKSGLSPKHTLKAAHALVCHLEKFRDEKNINRPSLLTSTDDDEENAHSKLDVPLWLQATAKQHLATSHSLKPGKVIVPHTLYSSPQTRICLITADPPPSKPTAYKDLVNDPLFPQDLKRKVAKVINYSRLATKYKDFERRRQLLAEFDLFLADERIIRFLPVALGRTFYKSSTKRPIPISLTGKELWGKKQKKTVYDRLKPKPEKHSNVIGKPEDVGSDIEKALSAVAIHLSPSPSVSIKVAYAGWPAEWISENVDFVVARLVEKYVPNGWTGLKSIYLKGPNTAALPVWLADELWNHENAVQSTKAITDSPQFLPVSISTTGNESAQLQEATSPGKSIRKRKRQLADEAISVTAKKNRDTIAGHSRNAKSSPGRKNASKS